jgi:hypothetical protein
VTTRSVRCSVDSAAASVGEGGVAGGQVGRHLACARSTTLGQRLQPGRAPLGLRDHAADVVVGDAEVAADLDVVGIFVLRAGEVADLEDGQFAQARVERLSKRMYWPRPLKRRSAFGLCTSVR